MQILEQALNKIKSNKSQRKFFTLLIQGLIGIAGKRNFRNLARYMQLEEHTFSRQMTKFFDFVGINIELIKMAIDIDDTLIAAQNASFIAKSGKHTQGLDYFWNGTCGKAEKGLEIDVIAIVKVGDQKNAWAFSAKQTPASTMPKYDRKKRQPTDLTRIDFYLDHLTKNAAKILDLGIKHIAADAFLSKAKYINGAVARGLHVVSKMRKDARLQRVYNGPQKARGRKKQFDVGRVTLEDFVESKTIQVNTESTELYSCVAYSIALKRLIKVVLVRKQRNNKKLGEALLFTTDLELDMLQIYEFYVSRFQIEFVFRDAKGFTGLGDCQSRDKKRIDYHINASLTALNVARIQDIKIQKSRVTNYPFSMANWTRQYHVRIIAERFIIWKY
jgi:hypothetical protein